jgi:ribulose-phosphate 3-epimerase
MLVAPSLLAADFSALGKEVEKVSTSDMLHIDIMDGCFVPNISMGSGIVKSIRDKSNLVFDVHLMIMNPQKYIEEFAKAGADIISFHTEIEGDIGEGVKLIKGLGKKAGLVIKPNTKAADIFPFAEELYSVTVMTVEPGFGGQEMILEALEKVREIKSKFPHILIEIDGGVNRETAHLCAEAGADILVAGTAVFKAESPEEEIKFLQEL